MHYEGFCMTFVYKKKLKKINDWTFASNFITKSQNGSCFGLTIYQKLDLWAGDVKFLLSVREGTIQQCNLL